MAINCLVTKLKGTVDMPDLPVLGDIVVCSGKVPSGTGVFNIILLRIDGKNSSLEATNSAYFTSGLESTEHLDNPLILNNQTAVISDRVVVAKADKRGESYDVEVKIHNKYEITYFGIYKFGPNYTSLISFSDFSTFPILKWLRVLSAGALGEGNVNTLAEEQLGFRDIQSYPTLRVTMDGVLTYTNQQGQVITPEANTDIYIVFKSGGYELHQSSVDGTLLYDSYLA